MTITHEEALRLIRERTPVLGTESLPLAQCLGRALAQEVKARQSSPPFDKSAMDGYAARSADVKDLPTTLRQVGASFAGGWPKFQVGPGECAEIGTGAPVPPGADCIIMVEHTRRADDGGIVVEQFSGTNICRQGEDITEGETLLRPGELLTPLKIGTAAAAGADRLEARRKPRLALLCTGTELVEPSETPRTGQIFNSNGPIVAALASAAGLEVTYLGIAGDSPEELRKAVEQGLESDLLAITGGVSVGTYDLVPKTLKEMGVETLFHGCAIKPGKPVLFGVRGERCVFGLPGNPFSCFVIFHILMRAAIARMQGIEPLPPAYRRGFLRSAVQDRSNRKTFLPCTVEYVDGRAELERIATTGSADIRHAVGAEALFVVPLEADRIEAGQVVEFTEV
jgi:molybdopterin molybdotransferase